MNQESTSSIYLEIDRAWASAYDSIERSPDDRDVFTDFISDLEKQSRTVATVELQPWLAIFEFGLEWLSFVHVALTNSLDDRKAVMGDRYLATWSLIGSAVSFGLSIRLLCISGFDTPAKALLRTYTEALFLCLADRVPLRGVAGGGSPRSPARAGPVSWRSPEG